MNRNLKSGVRRGFYIRRRNASAVGLAGVYVRDLSPVSDFWNQDSCKGIGFRVSPNP